MCRLGVRLRSDSGTTKKVKYKHSDLRDWLMHWEVVDFYPALIRLLMCKYSLLN